MTTRFAIDRDGNVTERPQSPADERATLIHCARVYLNEARARRISHPRQAASLLIWAGNARRRAAAIDTRPAQGRLL